MKRNTTLDVMKGIAILLVVLGHAIQKNVLNFEYNILFSFIYSFHMPMFFFRLRLFDVPYTEKQPVSMD